jgi:uncharacterized protein (DUF433 family)
MGLAPLIGSYPEIMGGAVCFAGTRVPVKIVLGALEAGDSFEQLQLAYPFLTQAHVDAAREFAFSNPEAVARPVRWLSVDRGSKRWGTSGSRLAPRDDKASP